jgi:hypothetical protein
MTTNDILTLARTWRERLNVVVNSLGTSSLPAQRITQQLRDAGAVSPASARPFRAHSRTEEVEFIRLLRMGIIREPSPGRYFLDQRALDSASSWQEIRE